MRFPRALVSTLLVLVAAEARAAVPLEILPPPEILRLEPLAARGELALIESHPNGRLKQVTIYAVANAPPDQVYYVLSHPAEYPQFVSNVVKAQTTGQTADGGLFYEWELEVPLINLKGTSKMTYRSPPAPGAAPVVDVETVRGDVADGTWRWVLLPAGPGRTIIAFHSYADISRSSWLLRKLISHNRTIEHGAALTSGIVFVKAVKLRAEALAGRSDGRRPRIDQKLERAVALQSIKGTFDAAALAPLLARGEVALLESFADGRLRQANLISYVYTPERRIFDVVATPSEFAKFVPGLERSHVIKDDGRTATYELEIHVPVLPNIEYITRMQREPESERVRMRCVGGDAKGSVYGWDFAAMGPHQTLAIYGLNGQLRKQSWFMRQMIKSEPFFEHGLNVSVALVTVLAMRG